MPLHVTFLFMCSRISLVVFVVFVLSYYSTDEVDTGSMQSEKIAMSGFDHEEKNDPLFATSVEVNVRGYYSNDKL